MTETLTAPLAMTAAQLADLEATFGLFNIRLADGELVSVRDTVAGDVRKPVLVCLHGIGSGAASWLELARIFNLKYRLLAWDAPGYGESTPLSAARPSALDYAASLRRLLTSLSIDDFVLVGHSLGALVAAAFTAQQWPGCTPRGLVLVSPAQGYGTLAREAQGGEVRQRRLAEIAQAGGIAAMAASRHGRLLAPQADGRARAWVYWNMARLNEAGYVQAVEMLCGGDLLSDCRHIAAVQPALPVQVWCGAEDIVTPPDACEAVAAALDVPLQRISGAGHACYVEQPAALAAMVGQVLQNLPARTDQGVDR
ncbi:alpha/beta fold hydrolase [Kerstersia sp.]|uniref:alpha/beta fold hydrolase n=1 Tax=Kerstersia sp. TaxID=1930783 RepID=UPI003F93C2E6